MINSEKSLLWDLDPGSPSTSTFGTPQQAFSGLIVIGTDNIIGAQSNLAPIYPVVQHWLLATDSDHIAIGLSLSLHPCSKIDYHLLFICERI